MFLFFKKRLFPFSIKNTTNNKLLQIVMYKESKTKNYPQPKNEPLTNFHLAVPNQYINLTMT